MRLLKIIFCILLAVGLQGAISRYIPYFEYLDLTLIIVTYFSLKRNPMQGTLVGSAAGLAYDAVTTGPLLGASGFTKTLIGFTIASTNVYFAIDRKLLRLFVVVLASIANVLTFIALYWIFSSNNPLPSSSTPQEIAKLTAWQAAGNLILSFFIFPILDQVFADQPYSIGRRP
ncbi:MAG: rod shape-determining protein MreD [Acidobacteriota bacterium]|nr:rod shape-determining protein MreD [Blastocatellia bacterium]MDW8411409.1 rod shape-determining protein MreD [Acidobacteriota bacterium]